MSFELCYWVYLATVSGTVLSASFKKQDLFLSHEYSNFSHFVEINEHHADRTQGIISAINYMSDESYPIVMVDNRRPQKYTNLIAFFFFLFHMMLPVMVIHSETSAVNLLALGNRQHS